MKYQYIIPLQIIIASDMKYQHIIPLRMIIDHIIISLYQHIIPLQIIISSLYLPIPSILISQYTISQYATDLTPISRFIQDRLGRDDLAIPGMIVMMMMLIVKVIMMTCTKVMIMMRILGGRVFGYF